MKIFTFVEQIVFKSVQRVNFLFFCYFLRFRREIWNCCNFIQFYLNRNCSAFICFFTAFLAFLSCIPLLFNQFSHIFFTFCLLKDQFHNSKLKVNNVTFVLGIHFGHKFYQIILYISVWIVMHFVVDKLCEIYMFLILLNGVDSIDSFIWVL